MNDGGETSFELVKRADGVKFHVSDHGEDLPTHGSRSTLSVRRDGKKSTFEGRPGRHNELFFPKARFTPADHVQVKVTFENGSVAVGRFPAKKAGK